MTAAMRLPTVLLATILLSVLIGCQSQKEAPPVPKGPITKTCEQLPTLEWQKTSTGLSADDALKLSASLSATAKAEIDKAKQASADAKLSAELTKKLKQDFSASAEVSQDFWQQDVAMTQMSCWLSQQSQRPDLPPGYKEKFLDQELAWSGYLHEFVDVKKKNAPNQ